MSQSKQWANAKLLAIVQRAEMYADDEDQGAGGGGQPPSSTARPVDEYDDDDMSRIERLEQFASATGERLARIETKLDQVVHDVGQWKWFMLGAVVTIVLAVLGTGIGIQQMTVATFQGAAEQQQRTLGASPTQQQPIIINVPAPATPQPTSGPAK